MKLESCSRRSYDEWGRCGASDEYQMPLFTKNREAWLRRAEAFSDSRWGVALLALIAFADSSVLPVLPDLLLVPMLLLRPDRGFLMTVACVIASSVGALVGYGIGHFAWAALGQTVVDIYGQAENFHRYQRLVEHWGVWIIIAKSFTPIPFKFIAIAAGVASMSLVTFTFATLIGRTLHFAIVAALVALWGHQFLQLVEKYERWLVSLGLLTAIGLGIVYATR
ncbi:VTT domain-containing protein [Bradyrhizobium sp.]|uniref:YqaA family protein n=1 Tax=Bradyrhizobium sp. TaxID=376 RepID=UPI001ED2DA76|nr:VTT domain-containing protein [Bradyrhizobium sp.]MBV9980661.1 DedA family protein [Bradyrhizobium sp.]